MQINNQKQKGIAETAVTPRMTILLNEEPYFRGLLIRSSVCNIAPLLSKQKTPGVTRKQIFTSPWIFLIQSSVLFTTMFQIHNRVCDCLWHHLGTVGAGAKESAANGLVCFNMKEYLFISGPG